MDLLVRALLPLSLLGTFLFNVHFGRLTSLAADPPEALSGATAAPAREVVAPTSPLWIDASSAGLSAGPHLPMPETPEALPVSVALVLGPSLPVAIPEAQRPGQAPTQKVDLTELHCRVPRSLMLHSAFGAQRMTELADAIERRGLQTTTYRRVLDGLQGGQCPPQDAIIVSIDDLSTRWLRPDFREMIQVFIDRGMVLVLGVVVQEPQDPALWDEYRRLETLGMEMASHTLDHLALSAQPSDELTRQISGSYRQLCEHLEHCPVSLVPPFGAIDGQGRVLTAATEYAFVVGIQAGRSFEAEFPAYVGRIPPDNDDQDRTMGLLERSFRP